jgi:hypothetical protein
VETDFRGLVARILRLEYKQVLDLGPVPACVLKHWRDVQSDRVVLIGERYLHILDRHPEIGGREEQVIRTALDPDRVQENRTDPRVAILYRMFEDGSCLRISMWITDEARFQNSIHSARLVREREVLLGVTQNREIWRKD